MTKRAVALVMNMAMIRRASLLEDKSGKRDALSEAVATESQARLRHDKGQLEEHVRQVIDTFNMAVASIEKEKAKLESDLKNADMKLLVLYEVVFPSGASVPRGSGTLDLTIVRLVDSRCVRLVVACHTGASRMQWFRLRKQDVLLDEITDMGLDPQTCKIGQVLSAFTRQSHKGRLESAMVEWLRTATAPGPVRRRKLWEFLTPDGSFALPLVITHSEVCLRQRAFEHHDYVSVTVNEDEGDYRVDDPSSVELLTLNDLEEKDEEVERKGLEDLWKLLERLDASVEYSVVCTSSRRQRKLTSGISWFFEFL
ncbi:hypothetical protein AK812_SmicGene45928 [Symbiodinium microadriaticum]|uniref:Uncharacterized protein n=1 Tax=Symbiodinium microadriaticum TaxID=2951 RepID=A0A1Q9BUY6_SYMMI|nr:hypothetical protein AK812_SmicGene45928 [Symbiodinium microadriaticum]